MSDESCSTAAKERLQLFTADWYETNSLEVYLDNVEVTRCVEFNLCENWVEHAKCYEDGEVVIIDDEVIFERSYGEVTLKIRRG